MNIKDKVFLISLGCTKNLVDSENMLGLIKSKGFDFATSIEEAKIAVVNTCAFIKAAVEETIDTILELISLKAQGRLKKIVVVGCFVQRYGYKLQREMPEVDGWLGKGEIYRVADLIHSDNESALIPFYINRPTYLADHCVPRIQTTHFFSSYLKIAEGCSHSCAYCIIPNLTGPFRSRGLESLVIEAKKMVGLGVKEINLIAQDTTMYGEDLGKNVCLEELMERLSTINGLKWIRLLYCYPDGVSDRLLNLIESEEIICPYIDLPIQHVNEKILKAMRRNNSRETPFELIERIRSLRRKISIRTTLMVGFPGETEEIFDGLCSFVGSAQVDHLGAFVFNREKGTSAARFKSTVDKEMAEKRLDRIMNIQADISRKANQQMVGNIIPVLVEELNPETDLLLNGRTETMAPDVDGQVLINRGEGLIGEIMPVLISEAHTYDLVGEIMA